MGANAHSVVCAASVLLLVGCGAGASTSARTGVIGPELALPGLDGRTHSVGAHQPGELLVLAFWATWCQPCQQELAKLDELHARFGARGLRIYAINIDGPDTVAQVPAWVQRENYGFEVLLDRETRVLTRYNPRGDIPYFVVLDADGRVLQDHQGYMPGDVDKLATFVDARLPAGP